MSRAVFLDRDGTLLDELGYLARAEDLRLYPDAADAVRRLNDAGFLLVVVTNQSGIARGLLGEDELERVHARLADELERGGAHLDLVLHCPHHPDHGEAPLRGRCACRKPEPGLFFEAARRLGIDLAESWAIGDSARDVEAARRAGVRGRVLVATGKGRATLETLDSKERAELHLTRNLSEAADLILASAELQGR